MITYFLFAVGFFILIKSAGLLINGGSALAKKWGISDLVIGLTIVAFGTSAPELIVNIIASIRGNASLAFGNIIGSNLSNILLILGIAALIYPLTIKRGTVWREIPFSILAVIVLFYLANDFLFHQTQNILSHIDGVILISFFILFIIYTFFSARVKGEEKIDVKTVSISSSLLMIVLGSFGLFLGGKWIVDGAVLIAKNIGTSQAMIGLTIVAVGTSLPELATSIIATFKRNADIAIGNIVGSNIFNIFWVLGLSSFIRPLNFNVNLNPDLILCILVSFLLFLFLVHGKKHFLDFFKGEYYTLERWEGIAFVIIYILYIVSVVIRR
ncbi:sodium:calcium antiporter [bacterium]|nr:MAG: sodium:calcium antiporter [bacterium]